MKALRARKQHAGEAGRVGAVDDMVGVCGVAVKAAGGAVVVQIAFLSPVIVPTHIVSCVVCRILCCRCEGVVGVWHAECAVCEVQALAGGDVEVTVVDAESAPSSAASLNPSALPALVCRVIGEKIASAVNHFAIETAQRVADNGGFIFLIIFRAESRACAIWLKKASVIQARKSRCGVIYSVFTDFKSTIPV